MQSFCKVPQPSSGRRLAGQVSILALLAAPPASAQTQTPADTFQPWQAVTYQSVVSIDVSPDGGQIAFLRGVPRRPMATDSGPAWTELFVLRPDGRETPFVTGEVTIGNVIWTAPDELAFLFQRPDDAHTAVYGMSTAGGEARKVFEHDAGIASFDISPDGRWLAFLATETRSPEAQALASKGFNQQIYEEDLLDTRLYLADLESGDTPAERDVRALEVEGSIRSVRFSPDGTRLLAAVTPTPLVDDSYVAQSLKVMDLGGTVVTTLGNEGKLGHADWSPDGSRIALVASADRNDPAPGRLFVTTPGTGTLDDVLPDLEGHVSTFDWLDGDTLVYVADLGTGTEVGTIGADGSGREVLVPAGDLVVNAVDAGAGDRLALVADTPRHPPELYTRGGAGELARRTSSNAWLPDLRLADQEVIRYAARDGLEIEGTLIRPLDYEAGRRYPLILVVHGGPESHYRNGWLTGYSTPGQVAAARGFAVFHPNYRGSTGRGVEFSKVSQAAAAGAEFDDLIDGVDHLIEMGLVDRDRVGITGGSYGGYASAWGATYYSERFAASIPFVGISDTISKMGTTDIPQEMYDAHHRKWLWDDWAYFLESSPIYYATRNETPTLILHGAEDPRVHPSQSLELYRQLKLVDQAPVRLVLYPGEGHGNARSAARFDYALRTLRWMEHYLQGPGGDPPDPDIAYADYLPWAGDDVEVEEEAGAAPASGAAVRVE